MSTAERLLWWALKGDRLGVRFRRSVAAGPYILDFYCASANLCVEVDGEQHDDRATYDGQRDATVAKMGVRTLRIASLDVIRNLDGVVAHIAAALEPPPPLRGTSPRCPGEEERMSSAPLSRSGDGGLPPSRPPG